MNILRKLTIKNLMKNKLRTIMTILGIMLSVGLITVIIGIFTGFIESSKISAIQANGNYTVTLLPVNTSDTEYGFTEENRRSFAENRNVQAAEVLENVTVAMNPHPSKSYQPYINIMSITTSAFDANNSTLKSGRYPEKDDELLLTNSFMRYSEKEYKVGDVIELETGKRVLILDFVNDDGEIEKREVNYVGSVNYIGDEYEKFVSEGKKKYTVVGILDNEGGQILNLTFNGSNAFTYRPPVHGEYMNLRLYDDAETNYNSVMAQIFGVDKDYLKKYQNRIQTGSYSETINTEFAELKKAFESKGVESYHVNMELIKAKHMFYEGMSSQEKSSALLSFMLIGIIIVIIVTASVFIIRNSFAMSVTERIRHYGMLASTGATPRQIRRSVFFEAILLGMISIPMGMAVGAGVTAALVVLVNKLLYSYLSGIKIVYDIPFIAVAAIFCLGMITVIMSALNAALTAAKISPLEAIRSNSFIKIGKKNKEKSYKVPELIKKLFGVGGCISWKNMKRSRKQYSTTVLSIIVSVAVYLAANSFIEYNLAALNVEEGEMLGSKYDLSVHIDGTECSKIRNNLDTVVSVKGADEYIYTVTGKEYTFIFNKNSIPEESLESPAFPGYLLDEDGNANIELSIVGLDDKTFESICKSAGKNIDECRYKGFLKNEYKLKNLYGDELYSFRISDDLNDISLTGYIQTEEYPDDYDFLDESNYDEDGLYIGPEPEITREEISVDIAGEIRDDFRLSDDSDTDGILFVSVDWFEKYKMDSAFMDIDINSSDPNALEDYYNELKENEDPIDDAENYIGIGNVYNKSRYISVIKSSLFLVKLFVYGFIIVISLIGITNIFNTITTNMNMRRKEFAMLRSVGMTNKEFNRMIRVESFIYTFKSLMIGLPVGLVFNFLLSMMYKNMNPGLYNKIGYIFPWKAVLICVLAVFVLLWVIMKFSLTKIRKMNIIETIRNNNI